MPRFTMPRDVYFGRDSTELLAQLRGKRAVIVIAGDGQKQGGSIQRVENALKRTGMELRLVRSAWPQHPGQAAGEGAGQMLEFEPDWIVALGSAAIDAAKIMWILYEYPEATLKDLRIPFSLPSLRRKARFAAVSVLDGGVSAVSAFAAVEGSREQGAWHAADYDIVPDIVVADPELSAVLAAETIAQAGMTVLAHGVGSMSAHQNGPFAEAYAQRAAELVLRHLGEACAQDGPAREQIHYAQCLAGLALSNTQAGLVCALARQAAGVFPQLRGYGGAVNSILLPHVIRFNSEDREIRAAFGRVARMLGIRSRLDQQAAEALAQGVENLAVSVGLPHTLQHLGIDEEAFQARVHMAAVRTAADLWVRENLRPVSAAVAERLLRQAFGE